MAYDLFIAIVVTMRRLFFQTLWDWRL